MLESSNKHPHEAVITASFFALGQLLQWFDNPDHMQMAKDVLSIISFSISIVVGIRSLMKKSRKQS